MVLVKMLMEIDPLSMRGSMVMTMATISPSRRDVSMTEQLRRSPRLVPPRFHLETVALHPESFLMIFFQGKIHHIAEDGHQGTYHVAHEAGGRAQGVGRALPSSWTVGGPPLVLSSPNMYIIFQN